MKEVVGKLCMVLCLCSLVVVLLIPSLRQAKQDVLLRATLRQLQAGVMSYLEEKEHVVMLQDVPGGSLVQFLQASGHLKQAPLNPATGLTYGSGERDADWIRYEARDGFKSFVLRAMSADGEQVRMTVEGGGS